MTYRSIAGALCCFIAPLVSAQTTTTFEYTGEVQTYIVPACATTIEVELAGASGGGTNSGNGSTVTATIDVVPGQVIEVYVGGAGECPGAGFNGGGPGSTAVGGGNESCGGGGASDLRFEPFGLADRIIVAAGGGGMGGGDTDAMAGDGGCDEGTLGDSPFGVGGSGGTQDAGGNGGPPWIDSGTPGENGSFGVGGFGAPDPCFDVGPGGGGGGGYYGGGGGGSDCFSSPPLGGGGGGGGSSLVPVGGNCTPANNTGNGLVTITATGSDLALSVEPMNSTICIGESVEFNASGAVNYMWGPSNTLNTTTGTTVVATPDSTQQYFVIGDDGESCSDTLYLNVEVIPYPELSVAPDNPEICIGESIELSASGADNYLWSPSTGLDTNTGPDVIASPNQSLTYTITGDTEGCESEISVEIVVHDLPEISYNTPLPVLCPGDTMIVTPLGAVSFSWDPITGITEGDASVWVYPETTTVYTITGTDANGCVGTTTLTATVSPLPQISAGPDQTMCSYASVQLFGSAPPGSSASWTPSTGLNNPSGLNPIAEPNQTTTYTLEVTDENGCTNSDEVTVTVIPIDAAFLVNPASGPPPLDVSFTNNSITEGAGIYQWNYGDGTEETTNFDLTDHTYLEGGEYTATLIVVDGFGCTDTATFVVNVIIPFELFIPNVFSPNGDQVNNFFQPEVAGVKSLRLEIYDRWGTIVHEHEGATGLWDGTKNGRPCSDGVYFYIVSLVTNENDQQTHQGTVTLVR